MLGLGLCAFELSHLREGAYLLEQELLRCPMQTLRLSSNLETLV